MKTKENREIIEFDEHDKAILKALQENCVQQIGQLAKKIGIDEATLRRRIKKLKKNNVILGYKAVLNPRKFNQNVVALVLVRVRRSPFKKGGDVPVNIIVQQLIKFNRIQEIHTLVGAWDMLLKIRGQSLEEIVQWMIDDLKEIEGIRDFRTTAVFKTSKETLDVDVS